MRLVKEVFTPKPPFNLSNHLEVFSLPGLPAPHTFNPAMRSYRRLLVQGWEEPEVMLVKAMFRGEPWSPRIDVQIALTKGWVGDPAETAGRLFRIDFDYNEFLRALEDYGDKRLLRLAQRHPGLRPTRQLSVYEALVDAIVKQRVALRAALKIQSRLVRRYGYRVESGGEEYFSAPSPVALAGEDVDRLRAVGVTRVKARALVEVARAELEGRLPELREVEADPWGAARELTRIYGVGVWTAELVAAMVHPRFPIGPTTDLAVRRGLKMLLGVEVLDEGCVEGLGDYLGLVMYLASLEYEMGKGGRT